MPGQAPVHHNKISLAYLTQYDVTNCFLEKSLSS